MNNRAPDDWSDKDAWDRYYSARLLAGEYAPGPDIIVFRFVTLARDKGGRIWFPGCGLDPYPAAYAKRGCNVLATDFSGVAVRYQQHVAAALEAAESHGSLTVAEHDFTQAPPDGKFDVVINCRAFQGLSPAAMAAAAGHFYAALRPGGVCLVDTMNVQGDRRDLIEDSLMTAGFYIPFQKSVRWYRAQLEATGIVYGMVLGRPRIPNMGQYPREDFRELAGRDQKVLDSFRAEYERRCEDETAEVNATTNDPATIVARVIYSTG